MYMHDCECLVLCSGLVIIGVMRVCDMSGRAVGGGVAVRV